MVGNTKEHFNARSERERQVVSNPLPAPQLDLSEYVDELTDHEITETQAKELLSALVPVLWHSAELGFRGDICEVLLSCEDSGEVDSSYTQKAIQPSKAGSEVATQ